LPFNALDWVKEDQADCTSVEALTLNEPICLPRQKERASVNHASRPRELGESALPA